MNSCVLQMKRLVSWCVIVQAFGLIYADFDSVMTLNHPDKNGYQSSVAGSEKHKYGYELKDNKHFHHTTTEKDGVRLGCYGYELEGKKYSTQYVADGHGYRVVSNQDLITVYPKSGGKRKAMLRRGSTQDSSEDANIRYFFPDGCKNVDVLIDNSSRLRAFPMPEPEIKPKLPVTLKSTTPNAYIYSTPASGYIPPGPANIYAPVLIPVQTSRPPAAYLPPVSKPPATYLPPPPVTQPPVTYLPPPPVTKPPVTYLPPPPVTQPPVTYLPPPPVTQPPVTYLPPPTKPPVVYLPPVTTTKATTTSKPPIVYLPPTTKKPPVIYLPPETTTKATTTTTTPANIYLPPKDPPNIYLPPTSPRPTLSNEIVPPAIPEEHCESNVVCCDEPSAGRFVIPIKLKQRNGSACYPLVAKLIIPTKGFDMDSIRKLSDTVATEEFDATQLIRNILQNLA